MTSYTRRPYADNLSNLAYISEPSAIYNNYSAIDREALRKAIKNNLEYLESIDNDTEFNYGGRMVRAGDVARTQRTFLQVIDHTVSEEMLGIIMEYMFEWYQAPGTDGRGKVVFTGYYVPEIEGSLSPSEKYRYPLYRPPKDLKKDSPYYTRGQIDGLNVLEGKGFEIAWLADPVEAYFLHIQGSGTIKLPDGSMIGVHYSGNNGQPYISIGKFMIDKDLIRPKDGNVEGIKQYLRNNPDKLDDILYQNPRYIFFKLTNSPAKGSLQVPLTPGHSIATDPSLFPRGGLSFIKTTSPVVGSSGKIDDWMDIQRFVVNQDEGAAIKGAGRVDLFWGEGPDAGKGAGFMKEEGELFFLLQK